ncbi:putative repeat protein (TIGR01451 family) [Crossiella equi]|uniref:alpha-amylase n=3 Tax=Crossiella equi TaxID=130796 RepID=A0ABS5A9V9_9PSEU|nr:SdrD B-like domain-containing protein [Crossiella equi]MBP2473374.1 putative repeat protein (TIGR01451 family) [Crossiella equi]
MSRRHRRWRSRVAAGLAPAVVLGLTAAGGVVAPPRAQAQPPVCPTGTTAVPITWGANGAVRWPRNSMSTSAENIAGSGLDMDITLTDPAQRNGDDSNPLQDIGEANSGAGQRLFGWDPRVYTETDGAYGPGFFTIEMNSLNVGDTLTFRFKFNYPVLLPDFSVGDIDYSGLGASPAEEPWNSFQDQVQFTANRQGLPVGVTLAPRGGNRPVITGGTAVGGPYQQNVVGDVTPDDPAGTLSGKTNEPVTEFVLAYSNGPDDEAAEAGPSYPPPIPPLGAPANSVSDSHAVRLNFFTTCVGTGSIGDTLYTDVDGDGVQDPGEPGIAGAKVQLLDPQGNVVQTATTDASGKYLFEQLPAFNWTVRVDPTTLPPGYTQTADPDATKDNRTTVNLSPGQNVLTADFGYQPPKGSVSGTVFSDRNDNGVLNPPADAGIAGVPVKLTGTDLAGNAVNLTTTTGADGKYGFPNVPAGTYTVTESQPNGYTDGKDVPGNNAVANGNDSFTVTLPLGGSSANNNFAELATGSLAGQVYVDANNNGVRDSGEAPIPGVEVKLTGTDDAGNAVSLTANTDANGQYVFSRLRPGTYAVAETQPAAFLDGKDKAGSAGGTVGADEVTAIPLGLGVAATGYDFGELPPAGISGAVVEDDGTPIPGVTVTLTGNGITRTTTSGPDGSWSFPNLPPGTYTVTETQPKGFGDGPDKPGPAGGTATEPDTIGGITLVPGQNAPGNVFTEKRSSLAGQVYADANDNGVRDPGEAPIAGAEVTLSGTDANGKPVSLTATTGADGTYLFDRLLSGSYTVTEKQPAGYLDGKDKAGSAGGTVGEDTVSAITLPPGTAATGYDFGELPPAGISGRVVEDDGTPIPGVTITLTGNGPPRTTTTGPDGSWSFPDLPPGTYTVTETQPPGFGDGPDKPGSAGGVAQQPDTISGITLAPGQSGTGYLFVENRSTLGGNVYTDANDNGVRDSGEAGIPGTTVTLTGTDANGKPVSRTTTTDADGKYFFDRLLSGTYTVTETQPAGYLDGKDKAGNAGGTVGDDTVTGITLPAGSASLGYDFGELPPAGISGKVVEDDGTPIPGVTITLTGNGTTLTTATGPDGSWSFPNLPPGTYTVTETQPPGFGDGPDTPGSAGGTPQAPDTISGITLTPGKNGTGYVFTEKRSSLAGQVYADANDNGVRDPGEAPIPGVQVTLSGTDANGAPVARTATTDADGKYVFDRLLSGTYTVTEKQPAGYLDGKDKAGSAGGTVGEDTVSAITLPVGTAATGYDFGELPPAGISGRVVEDDGTPIPGVTITLTGNGPPRTTTTGPDGTWSFPDLPPGTYTVTETQPPGFGDGPDKPGSAGGVAQQPDTISGITLTPGQGASEYVFTETRSSLAGQVYVDTNNNGVRDPGEPGIPGTTVTLAGTDAAGQPVTRSTTTDADGEYVFGRLLGGDYTVTETQPEQYTDGKDRVGSLGGELVPPDSVKVTVPAGKQGTGYDFGEVGAAVTGTVWLDTNGNGTIDPAETTRLPGVEVVLLDGSGKEVAKTTTGPDGTYAFPGLPPGDYTVRQTQPGGYGTTTPNEVEVTVPAGGTGKADFGEQLGAIGDFVWSDTNANGVQDADEPGVAGVGVVLYGKDGKQVAKTTTGPDGTYVFTDLPAGEYAVGFQLPAGQAFTPSGKGTGATGSDADLATGRSPSVTVAVVDGKITQRSDVDAGLVAAKPDLAVDLVVDKTTVDPGDTATYTGVVANTGNTPVTGQEYRQTVPPGLTITQVTGDGWTCQVSGQEVVCTRPGVLLPGEKAPPVTVVTTARTPGTSLTSTATTKPLDGQVETTTANNTDTVDLTVNQGPAKPEPGKPGPGKLADTGDEVGPLVAWALLLLLGGTGLVAGSLRGRRRRD